MIRPRRPGYILVLTLVLCGLSFALLLVSSPGAPLFGFAREQAAHEAAWDAAASAQEAALAGLLDNADLPAPPTGSPTGTPALQDLRAVVPQDGAEVGEVRFTPAGGEPSSTSNVRGTTAVQGWGGRTVPPGFVHLVSLGRRGSADGEILEERQALVRPVLQYLYEDFNADGNGSTARQAWTPLSGVLGFRIQDGYLFLGNPQYQHNRVQYLRGGLDVWTDYDLEAHVAYYGNASFGLCFRTSDHFEGYMMELQPRIGLEKVQGLDFTVTGLISAGTETLPDPDIQQTSTDPLFMLDTDLTTRPVEWTFRVSVQGHQAWLSVRDPSTGLFRTVGTPFDLARFRDALVAKGYPPVFRAGQVGFWAQVDTGVGFTNVTVTKRGAPMLQLPAQWSR